MHILTGDLGKLFGALGIQSEVDFRLAQVAAHHHGALDSAAGHFSLLPDLDFLRALPAIAHPLLALEDFVTGLNNAILDVLIAGGTHQTEFQECRSLNGNLGAFLIGGRQTGQLDENAVVPFRLNDGLSDPELVNALAQHFDRMRESSAGIGRFGQLVGVHADEEGRAALQVQAQADAAGGFALQTVQDISRGVQLILGSEGGEIVRNVVGADRLRQVVVRLLRHRLLQRLGFLEKGAKGRVAARRLLAEEQQQVPPLGRIQLV